MDDLEKRLEELLSDPDTLAQLSALANSLTVDGKTQADEQNTDETKNEGSTKMPDLSMLSKLKDMAYMFGGGKDDSQLLMALKPYLRSKRQDKVDEALKMLNLIKLAPLLKELNI